MKVIDLLNKIANGTQPKIIIFDTEKYIWEKEQKEYRRYPYENNLYYSLWSDYNLMKCLNDEIEIIEEDKPIEKITIDLNYANHYSKANVKANGKYLAEKINEIIDVVNELKERR
jgi:DNA-directed RNA polymerase specialized sigma54-like protein